MFDIFSGKKNSKVWPDSMNTVLKIAREADRDLQLRAIAEVEVIKGIFGDFEKRLKEKKIFDEGYESFINESLKKVERLLAKDYAGQIIFDKSQKEIISDLASSEMQLLESMGVIIATFDEEEPEKDVNRLIRNAIPDGSEREIFNSVFKKFSARIILLKEKNDKIQADHIVNKQASKLTKGYFSKIDKHGKKMLELLKIMLKLDHFMTYSVKLRTEAPKTFRKKDYLVALRNYNLIRLTNLRPLFEADFTRIRCHKHRELQKAFDIMLNTIPTYDERF